MALRGGWRLGRGFIEWVISFSLFGLFVLAFLACCFGLLFWLAFLVWSFGLAV